MLSKRFVSKLTKVMSALGIVLLMTGLILSAVQFPVKAAGAGAIWTTTGSCGEPQNINHYNVGDVVYINGAGFTPNTTLPWAITGQPGGASADPDIVVASGTLTTNASGAFCVNAYTIYWDDDGTYTVDVVGASKNDNYRVQGITPAPGLSLTKTASTGTYNAVGNVITYTLVATNTGNIPLTGVTISDPKLGTLTCAQPANLAVGATLTCTGSYTITQADMDAGSVQNTATADSNETGPATDTEVVTAVTAPGLSIDKTATPGTYDAVGDVINYTIVATNTGNVTLTGVTISDPKLGALTCSQPATLAPGASLTCTGSYTIIQADLDNGSVQNTATADSVQTAPVSDSETVTAEGVSLLSIVKTANTGTYDAVGDVITYTLVATNNGNVTLTGVTISDPKLGALTCAQPATLAPGASLTCTGSYTITQGDLDAGSVQNTGTADSDQTGPATDTEIVTAVDVPVLSIVKTATPGTYDQVGDVISYTLVATNEGNVTLTGVNISDPKLGALTCTQPVTLTPGQTLTCTGSYTITQADLDAGSVVNTATADSAQTEPVTDTETVTANGAPVLSIVKTATPGTYDQVGDVISYTLVAKNEGNVTLTNVTISDPKLGTLTCTQPVTLAPGETLTCTGSYTITQADLDNGSVENTGTADSIQTNPVTDSEVVAANGVPVLSLVKTASPSTYDEVGDVIGYTLVAKNEGNVTLTSVNISDPKLGTLTCTQPVTLAPGETLTCTGSYTISQADLDAGSVVNTATADSTQTEQVTDSETVTAQQLPQLAIVKTASPDIYDAVGDVISYTLVATNTGNVTLTGVSISDPKLGTLTCTQPVTLAPGETLTCTGSYTITQADLDAGSVENTGTADSIETDPVTDTEVVAADGVPVLSITKTAEPTTYDAVGDVISYTLVAENEGNVTLTGVSISDPKLGTLTCTQPVTLAPGETLTCTGSYTITQADLDNGSVENTGTADSVETDPVTDTEVVNAQASPLLTLVKTASPQTYKDAGDVINYTLVATNAGNVTLTNVSISDPKLGILTCTQPVTLTPGQTLTCTGSYTIIQSDVVAGQVQNIATADSAETDPVTDTEVVTAEPPDLQALLFIDPFCYADNGQWTMAVQVQNPNAVAVQFTWSVNGGALQVLTAGANAIVPLANLPLGQQYTIAITWGTNGFAEQRARLDLEDCQSPPPPPPPPPGPPVPVTAEQPAPVVESAELIPVTGIDLGGVMDLGFLKGLMIYLGLGFLGAAFITHGLRNRF